VLYNDLKACNDFELAGNVACPALLVLGKRDVMTPPKAAASLSEKIKAKTVTVSFSGHSLMAEAPDATLDALIQFFS
jgi:pimeloyl-ACP methyl ester carboxylesterase